MIIIIICSILTLERNSYERGEYTMKIYWTKIIDIIDESPEIKTYMLERPEDFTWEEGAHTHLGLQGFRDGDKPDKGLVRHMSIITLPSENTIGITTRIREQCSRYKSFLRTHKVNDKVALFKTISNVPLKRKNNNVYLLSQGVGLATFRPLVLEYLENTDNINKIHSLNIDSSRNYLYPDIFKSVKEKNFTAKFVDNRKDYYTDVAELAKDQAGLFYVVGSDEFLQEHIDFLMELGIKPEQIMLDKHPHQREAFFSKQSMTQ